MVIETYEDWHYLDDTDCYISLLWLMVIETWQYNGIGGGWPPRYISLLWLMVIETHIYRQAAALGTVTSAFYG